MALIAELLVPIGFGEGPEKEKASRGARLLKRFERNRSGGFENFAGANAAGAHPQALYATGYHRPHGLKIGAHPLGIPPPMRLTAAFDPHYSVNPGQGNGAINANQL